MQTSKADEIVRLVLRDAVAERDERRTFRVIVAASALSLAVGFGIGFAAADKTVSAASSNPPIASSAD